jgi:hypothetical protein
VISGTGFRYDLDALPFLPPRLVRTMKRIAGAPALSRNFESSVPGLYFTGVAAAWCYGPLMRFVCGSPFAAPRLAAHIAAGGCGTAAPARDGGLVAPPRGA